MWRHIWRTRLLYPCCGTCPLPPPFASMMRSGPPKPLRTRPGEQGARDMLEKIMARRNLPAPIRGNIPADGQPDYANMSSAAFAQVKKRLAQAASQGLHPSL